MRKHAFDMPDPNLSGNGPVFDEDEVNQRDPDFVKASKACQSVLRQTMPHPTDGAAQQDGQS